MCLTCVVGIQINPGVFTTQHFDVGNYIDFTIKLHPNIYDRLICCGCIRLCSYRKIVDAISLMFFFFRERLEVGDGPMGYNRVK